MVNFFILWPAYYRELDEKSPIEKPSVGADPCVRPPTKRSVMTCIIALLAGFRRRADTWVRPYRRLCRKAIRRIHVFTVQSYNFSHWQWRKMAKCGANGVIWW